MAPHQDDSAVLRIYAVGDIHGCIEELHALHALIQTDAATHSPRRKVIIYLGDYIDRGPDSRAVVDQLVNNPLPGFECVHLKGNHEDTLVRFLENPSIARLWLSYGGAATLLSYGVQPPPFAPDDAALQRTRRELSDALPPDHLAFYRNLPSSHALGNYLFVHAGVRPGVALDQQSEEDLLWIRSEFLGSDMDFGKVVVHGHNITPTPDVRFSRIGIDTGAFASGRLTCLVIEGKSRTFLCTGRS